MCMSSRRVSLPFFIHMALSKAVQTFAAKPMSSTIALIPKPKDIFPVTVNYHHKLQEMIHAGKYDWVNPNITAKNFPIARKGTTQLAIELVHFRRPMKTPEILQELDAKSLRPTDLPELLALGATYADISWQFPVVALGSVWQFFSGRRYVPALWGISRGRNLRLYWWDFRWL